jgi:hypothetical protein
LGGALVASLLIVGAILAGVLTTREKNSNKTAGRVKAPHTVVQSVAGGPEPVRAETKPLLDPSYPYQLDGKITDPSITALINATAPSADKQEVPAGAAGVGPLTNAVTAVAWSAVGGGAEPSAATICYVDTAKDLVKATTAASPCIVIVLTRGYADEYEVKQTMNITTTKVIVGNPVNPPHIKPKGIVRTFQGKTCSPGVYPKWTTPDEKSASLAYVRSSRPEPSGRPYCRCAEVCSQTHPSGPCIQPSPYRLLADFLTSLIKPCAVPRRSSCCFVRCYAVMEGGSLDLRAIAITRASGRLFETPEGGSTRLILGGTALIFPGGSFHARG